MDFLEACQEIISIDSSPAQGTKEVVDYVCALSEKMGFETSRTDDVVNGVAQSNVVVGFGALKEEPLHLLLQTHLDTVDPGGFALWNKTGFNPFQPSIRGRDIYGLGVAEAKLDFLCKLFAMSALKSEDFKRKPLLLGTYGEEEKMRGALKAVNDKDLQCEYALIGGPTDLNMVYAGKGVAHMEIIIPFDDCSDDYFVGGEISSSTQSKLFHGHSAHSAHPQEGQNAIVSMLNYLDELPESIRVINVDGGTYFNTIPTQAELEFDISAKPDKWDAGRLKMIYNKIKDLEETFNTFPSPDFDPPMPTINLGFIRTKTDHIQLQGAVRWSSHISDRDYVSWMKSLSSVCEEQGAIFRVLDTKRPFVTDKSDSFVSDCLMEMRHFSPNSSLMTQPTTNEANVFQTKGFKCVVFGPGKRTKNVHTPQEKVSLDDLTKARRFYENIIKKVCL